MLVMPLVFVAIVGAFTRTKVTENLGRISAVVLAVLLGTVAVAALTGWAAVVLSGPGGRELHRRRRWLRAPRVSKPCRPTSSRWRTSRCRR